MTTPIGPVTLNPFPDKGGPKVAVLGGGVAGMSAAHELIERGFRVAVFERQPELCGGKARSLPVPVGDRELQRLRLIRKRNGQPIAETVSNVVFVPLIGEHGWHVGNDGS